LSQALDPVGDGVGSRACHTGQRRRAAPKRSRGGAGVLRRGGVSLKRFSEDRIGRFRRGTVDEPSAAESSRVADIDPVGGPIDCPSKALSIDKGFHQQHAMTEEAFPITHHTLLTQPQYA
jgi:hypothetical protein